MFEKSLYDLIRGLRNHKGNERAYIQDCIRECRREIKTEDMDLKATALLKLTYLEMFGHDMSWASFNVLEVMSSQKYPQKRVGYLGAVQSFRPDTEVLMLAENLLKKDLTSPMPPMISLPLVAIPHVISASMANSLLSDLIPRLSHSNANIRKKTIVTLYRLALVYSETLRPAWPRIKDRLLDENEDPSVTAAVVNVVCELGWRRPQDFLPLAPRLFDLLVEGTNNWMTIKIIKLFATLTPLEPRLIKKLLPPLTTIMQNTPAMSLLYECINGIITGGILDQSLGTTEGDDLARLCVNKLRGMLLHELDPNFKYVALLAFNRIAQSHPYMVAQHEDAILECLDGLDISIRLRALELVVNMVTQDNLTSIVERLMQQLNNSPIVSQADDPASARQAQNGIALEVESDDEDMQRTIRPDARATGSLPLPDDYRIDIIEKILTMCSKDTYSNIGDFDWYIDILSSLVRHVPSISNGPSLRLDAAGPHETTAYAIGAELRNVAIRVKVSRREATRAAEALISISGKSQLFSTGSTGRQPVLEPAVWIAGEFASHLLDRDVTLTSILHSDTAKLPPSILCAYIQAAMKILTVIVEDDQRVWSPERKTMTTLLLARVIDFLEPLTLDPDLEVQELAAEFLELTRLASEATSAHSTDTDDGSFASAPLLLTNAMPSLFGGAELNPVAPDAQQKVPLPEGLDLDRPINEKLSTLLEVPDLTDDTDTIDQEFNSYYYERPQRKTVIGPAAARLNPAAQLISYQRTASEDNLDPDVLKRRRVERRQRQADDPFYIASEPNSGTATPMQVQGALRTNNGEELDVDSIPIMELELDAGIEDVVSAPNGLDHGKKKNPRKKLEILGDEDLDQSATAPSQSISSKRDVTNKKSKSFLQVDSSGLGSLSLSDGQDVGRTNGKVTQLDIERREAEEAEMAAAMKEVERLRLEMQRAQERIEAREESVVVRKKRRKQRVVSLDDDDGGAGAAGGAVPEEVVETAVKKKKKKKPKQVEQEVIDANDVPEAAPVVKRKKKRREVTFDDNDGNDELNANDDREGG